MGRFTVSIPSDPAVKDEVFLSIYVTVTWTKNMLEKFLLRRMVKNFWGFRKKYT